MRRGPTRREGGRAVGAVKAVVTRPRVPAVPAEGRILPTKGGRHCEEAAKRPTKQPHPPSLTSRLPWVPPFRPKAASFTKGGRHCEEAAKRPTKQPHPPSLARRLRSSDV